MGSAEISKLEELANQPGLVAPITFTDGDNDSFLDAVRSWAVSQEKEIVEEEVKMGIMEAANGFLKQIYLALFNLPKQYKCLEGGRMYAIATAGIIGGTPLFGKWGHNNLTVYRGNENQRQVVMYLAHQDPLVHEYLHAYQRLLFDHLKQQRVIENDLPTQDLIIEHDPIGNLLKPFGTESNPLTYKRIKRFENVVLKELDRYQRSPSSRVVDLKF
jgi:hypothetical protein